MNIVPGRISVLLPVLNNQENLISCIESLLSQTYGDFEIIAIDDASSDNSFKILKKLRRKDKRLLISQNKKRYGMAVTLNRLVKMATGQYITFCDANSISFPQRFEKQIDQLIDNPKTAALGTQVMYTDTDGRFLSQSNFATTHEEVVPHMLGGSSIFPESVLLDRAMLPKDILYFSQKPYPHIYTDVLMKIADYATIENMQLYLFEKRLLPAKKSKTRQFLTSHVSLWLTSLRKYDYRPSIRSLVAPMTRSVTGSQA